MSKTTPAGSETSHAKLRHDRRTRRVMLSTIMHKTSPPARSFGGGHLLPVGL